MRNRFDPVALKEVAILASPEDSAAIAKVDIKRGATLVHDQDRLVVLEDIPVAHRFALRDLPQGHLLTHCGYPYAVSCGIRAGELLGKHNVQTYREQYESRTSEILGTATVVPVSPLARRTFKGYRRGDGLAGTRNYYLVIPTSMCASDVAVKIAQALEDDNLPARYEHIDGVVAAAHTEGCGCSDGDIIDRLLLTIRNTISHPNVAGALVIDLGCEKTNRRVLQDYLGNLAQYGKPVDMLSIIELGGTGNAIRAGCEVIRGHLKGANAVQREEVSLKHLVVGTKCGASDSFSGITANPIIGHVVDKVISSGGSGILTETPEMIGAEVSLIKKMRSRAVLNKFVEGMNYYRGLAGKLGVSMDGNFVPGNESGALLNPTLKSLGAIAKGGCSEIVDFLNYAERLKQQGLNLMNGPGNDLESLTGQVASGATLILFSTGMGTTEGSLIVPVIKIPSTSHVFQRMRDDMDFNAGRLLEESISVGELGEELLELAITVASGAKTRSEQWKKRSFQIWTAGKLSL